MSYQLVCGVEEVLGGGDGCGDFVDVDVFAGKGGVFEFVSTSAQCSQPAQRPAELGAYRVADGKVPAGLGGAQALLRQECFADEPGGVVDEDECGLGVVNSDGVGGLAPPGPPCLIS